MAFGYNSGFSFFYISCKMYVTNAIRFPSLWVKGGSFMDDTRIIDLYWARSEEAIHETDIKYGPYCRTIA